MKTNRLGRVVLPLELFVEFDIDNGCSMFNGAFVVDAQRDFVNRTIEILMAHRSFREIELGEITPTYTGKFVDGIFEGWEEQNVN